MTDAARSLLGVVDQDPYPFYEELRERGSVTWDDQMRAWLVTGFDDCAAVGRREDQFALPWTRLPAGEEVWGKRGLFMLSGDVHRTFHKRLLHFFLSHATGEAHSGLVHQIVDHLIDTFAARGRAELSAELADRLPIRVIVALFGLPWRDDALIDQIKGWVDDIGRWAELMHHGSIEEEDWDRPWVDHGGGWQGTWRDVMEVGRSAGRNLGDKLLPVVQDRRDRPGDDLLSELWRIGRALFDDWDEDDVLGICRLLCVAGSRTTATLICNATYLLLTHHELRERIVADRAALLPAFLEETLRLLPSLHIRVRLAAEDTELGGVRIQAGDTVHPLSAAANRDPSHYACPAQIDLNRPKIMHHQAFNVGRRHCVGAPLARVEALTALDALLTRLPGLRLDPAGQPPHFLGFNNRPYRPLHVLFDPTPPSSRPLTTSATVTTS